MSEKTSTVTEELKCDTPVPSISSPLEWLKIGGVEMKFSEKMLTSPVRAPAPGISGQYVATVS